MSTNNVSVDQVIQRVTIPGLAENLRTFVINNFMFGENGPSLGNGDSFLDKGIIDSTGVLELVSFLQERYAITIQDMELTTENLDSIDNLVRFVEEKLATATGQ